MLQQLFLDLELKNKMVILVIFTAKNCGFGTHIASLPFTTVYSYDQALQKEIAKEFIEHVYENDNTGKSFS